MREGIDGKVAVVTGTAHGIGRSIASELALRGARVYGCDIESLAATEALIKGQGGWFEGQQVDVTDESGVNDLVQSVVGRHGRIDILVNNAGGVAGQVGIPIEQVETPDWRRIFAINLDGAFLFTRAVAPVMKERQWGRIINISSGAGLTRSLTGIQAYAAAKAGLIGLTRQMAGELGPWNITVNCIAPGFIRSNPTTERQWQAMGAEGQRRLVESLALRRLGRPEDIAYGVLFFASRYADWVTSQVLSISGN